MAKIKLTAIDVVGILGNVGPVTLASKRGQPFVRRRYGHQTPSPAQEAMRDAFRTADAYWAHLSLADRQAWRDYRAWEHLNGYSQYMSINITRVRDGLPIIENPAMIP